MSKIESIDLDNNQENKLIEMCNKLFPEYNNKIYLDSDDSFITDFHEVKKLSWRETIHIHWFEFCLTHLSNKIGGVKSDYLKSQIFELDKHPVDYLYEQFLKLKQNQNEQK